MSCCSSKRKSDNEEGWCSLTCWCRDCVESAMDTQTHTRTLLRHECQSGIQLDFMQSSAQNLRHLPGLIRFSSLAPNPSHPRFRSLLLRFINPCSSASFPKNSGKCSAHLVSPLLPRRPPTPDKKLKGAAVYQFWFAPSVTGVLQDTKCCYLSPAVTQSR